MPSNGEVPRLLRRKVKMWQRRCLLTNWNIEILFKPIRKLRASTDWASNYQHGTMEFDSKEYPNWSEEYLDHLICHELYHLLTARVSDALEAHVGNEGEVYKAYAKADEAAADTFAGIIVQSYRKAAVK